MPLAITPSAGLGIFTNAATGGLPVYNASNPTKQPPLGTVVKVDDGHDFIYAQASGAVAAGPTTVVLTEPAMTVATGAGAWQWTGSTALVSGDRAWFRKVAI